MLLHTLSRPKASGSAGRLKNFIDDAEEEEEDSASDSNSDSDPGSDPDSEACKADSETDSAVSREQKPNRMKNCALS